MERQRDPHLTLLQYCPTDGVHLSPPRPAPTTAVCGRQHLGGVRRLSGEVLRSKASSTLVPYARISIAATGSTSQCREIRAGSVLRVLCHCHPALLTALNPASIQNRSTYQLMPAWSGGRPVKMDRGPSCSTYQTAINVQRRFSVALLNAVPVPIHPVSGRGTKVRAGRRRPPSAQRVTFFGYLMYGCQP